MINITLPDGAVKQYEEGVTALDIAKSISEGLARKVLAANVNGEVWDATRPITRTAPTTPIIIPEIITPTIVARTNLKNCFINVINLFNYANLVIRSRIMLRAVSIIFVTT